MKYHVRKIKPTIITNEAVEAGAAAQYENNTGHKWGDKPEYMAIWRHHAAVVLFAAESHLKVEPTIIDTVEELDELPVLTVVLNNGSNPHAWQKRHDLVAGKDLWYCTTDADYGVESSAIFEDGETATVLWNPTA